MGRKTKLTVSQEENVTTISGTAEAITAALNRASEKSDRKPIEIRAGELVDQMFCNYKYDHTIAPNTTNSVSTKSEMPVHPDLVHAFRKLDAHLAVICEEVEQNDFADINNITGQDSAYDRIRIFTVTSFQLSGFDDATSIVLSGLKELSTGESIKLQTPKISLDDSYPFAIELTSCLHDLVFEIEEYMKGNKKAESPQQELPFDEENYAEQER
jgi:hypothetical protein